MSSKSESSNVNGVIVISVTEQLPEYIIKKIIETDVLPAPSVYNSFIKGYEWKLDNRYYSATVTLYSIQEKTDFDEDICDNTQATIFYFDGKEPSSFENVLNWMPSLKDIESEVQLLICETFDCDEKYKKKILNWCVENEYELIEINPPPESDEEEDDGLFSKSKGFGRVIDALHAYVWSHLVIKDEIKPKDPVTVREQEVRKKINRLAASASSPKVPEDNSKKMRVDISEFLLEEQWPQKVSKQDDPEGESVEALFAKFSSMKEKASGLHGEERKKYAEKVAIAFWKAMGGAEDEIAGLDDDDDDDD